LFVMKKLLLSNIYWRFGVMIAAAAAISLASYCFFTL
jgi:hypothetical protein